jgi:hypothetical protein
MATLRLTLPNGKPTDDAVLHAAAHSMARAMDGDPWPPEDDHNAYFADHDQVIECEAIDAEAGEPETWDAWTDADRWEPTDQDSQWAAQNLTLPPIAGGAPEPFTPTAADWADYHEFCREVDERHELERVERLEDECRARFG